MITYSIHFGHDIKIFIIIMTNTSHIIIYKNNNNIYSGNEKNVYAESCTLKNYDT